MSDASKLTLREAEAKATKGEPAGSVALSVRYMNGIGVGKSLPTAILWLQRAADEDCPPAQDSLADDYMRGALGLSKDEGKAVAIYQKAAALNDAEAEYELGVSYENGDGVPRDLDQAFTLYKEAADRHGYPDAQYGVARAYLYGSGVQKDQSEAFTYAMKSAIQDYPYAEFLLAAIYYDGDSTQRKDRVEALKWLLLSATNGALDPQTETRAVDYSKRWANGLSTLDVAEAKRRAQEFTRVYGRHQYAISDRR